MKDSNPTGRHESDHYEIHLTGELDKHWTAWFDGLTVHVMGDGTTVIRGPVADQAALHGLLQRVRDLGLALISVKRIGDGTAGTTGDARPHLKGDT